MLGSIPHQKFCFYRLPTRDEQELSLGMLIRLQRIYTFFIVPCCYIIILGCFIIILQSFYIIFGTNLLTQCQVPVAVFCMFFTLQEINTKRSPNAGKLFVDFFGPEDIQWAEEAPGGCSEGSTTNPGIPKWVVPTLVASRTASLLYKYPNISETLGEST